METTWSALLLSRGAAVATGPEEFCRLAAQVDCPVVIVQGELDGITPPGNATALLEAIGDNASLVVVEGGGHGQLARDSVWFSLQVRALVDRVLPSPPPRRSSWTRAMSRRRRALFLSSPVGLGHTRRDVAIAQQLRELRPDLQVDWLTEHPVTQALEAAGERVHPASAWRSSESAHFESEAHGHELHAFQAVRRMDEVQAANFMVLQDVLAADRYDLVIADEAAETDYFLHENPELKSTAYAWLTDFVGWIPMQSGGAHEAWLTSDYNAQMVEHVARFPRVRDRSVFIGGPDDLVEDPLGPGLPTVRAWTEEHFAFPGYVSGTPVYTEDERAELRSRFGYRDDQVTCIVTAGGTAVGATLLNRVLAAHPYVVKQLPELRLVVVAGPRVDLRSLHPVSGDVEVHGYLPGLDQHLAACDIAVVQGGLTTCMELTANRRPFLYFPLADHFEQQRHVAHRLDRYRAGRRLQLADVTAEDIADALLAELGRPVDSLPVETGGARRAARAARRAGLTRYPSTVAMPSRHHVQPTRIPSAVSASDRPSTVSSRRVPPSTGSRRTVHRERSDMSSPEVSTSSTSRSTGSWTVKTASSRKASPAGPRAEPQPVPAALAVLDLAATRPATRGRGRPSARAGRRA